MFSPAPILPEERCRTHLERMQQDTDPTRFGGGLPVPLTLLAHRATATIANLGAVEYAQTAIGFTALFGRPQRLASRTLEHAVGQESEVLSGEAIGFPGQGDRRHTIALHRCQLRWSLWNARNGRGKRETVRNGVGAS
jgi:hypothetical protein